jgi:hypothetical protein
MQIKAGVVVPMSVKWLTNYHTNVTNLPRVYHSFVRDQWA